MNPEEIASLGRVVAQESDHDSDDSIYLTDVKKRRNSFKVSNTMKQLRKAEIVCKIIKLDFSMGYGSSI